MITPEERQYIKKIQGIPKSVLEKELKLMTEDALNTDDPEEAKLRLKVARWLNGWLKALELLKDEKDKSLKVHI